MVLQLTLDLAHTQIQDLPRLKLWIFGLACFLQVVVATVEESNLETFLFGTAAWEVALFGGSGKYVESDCEPLKLFHNCFNEAVYSLFEIRKALYLCSVTAIFAKVETAKVWTIKKPQTRRKLAKDCSEWVDSSS